MPPAGKANTVNASATNPSNLSWHAHRRYGDNVEFPLTDEQKKQVETDKAAWFALLARKSLNTKMLDKAARLRRTADEIEKQAQAELADWPDQRATIASQVG